MLGCWWCFHRGGIWSSVTIPWCNQSWHRRVHENSMTITVEVYALDIVWLICLFWCLWSSSQKVYDFSLPEDPQRPPQQIIARKVRLNCGRRWRTSQQGEIEVTTKINKLLFASKQARIRMFFVLFCLLRRCSLDYPVQLPQASWGLPYKFIGWRGPGWDCRMIARGIGWLRALWWVQHEWWTLYHKRIYERWLCFNRSSLRYMFVVS